MDALAKQTSEHDKPMAAARFMKMVYEPESQIPVMRSQLFPFMNGLAGQLTPEKQSPEEVAEHRNELLKPLISWLVAMAMRMKNPGFAEEKEYRMATFFSPEFFSPGDAGLVPRAVLKFDPSRVKEVMIGPGHRMDTRQASVRYYLSCKIDAAGQQKYPGVVVTPSRTPFRGD